MTMAYAIELHGYAMKDARAANAIAFCDTLGGGKYDKVRHYIDCTGIVPEWLAAKMRGEVGVMHKYIVTHIGIEHEIVAKSEVQAINYARYKLYQTRPLAELPPFSARMAVERNVNAVRCAGKLSRADIAARLRRMAS